MSDDDLNTDLFSSAVAFTSERFKLPTIPMAEPFGLHAIVDLWHCDLERITNALVIAAFGEELCAQPWFKMTPYGEPRVEYFAEGDPKAAGYSYYQWIETSQISGHFAPHRSVRSAHIEAFSCRDFDADRFYDYARDYFGRPDGAAQPTVIRNRWRLVRE